MLLKSDSPDCLPTNMWLWKIMKNIMSISMLQSSKCCTSQVASQLAGICVTPGRPSEINWDNLDLSGSWSVYLKDLMHQSRPKHQCLENSCYPCMAGRNYAIPVGFMAYTLRPNTTSLLDSVHRIDNWSFANLKCLKSISLQWLDLVVV